MAKDDDPRTHTAEHVLNQALIRVVGCERSTSTSLDKGKGKLDFHWHRDLTPEEAAAAEAMANEKIAAGLPVKVYSLTVREAGERMPVGKLPPDVAANPETPIRIVEVDGFDLCPCVGQHVESLQGLGHLAITGHEHAGERLRVRFKVFCD